MGKAGRGADQFVLRLPDGMRDRIKAEAEKSGRSMNAEIVARLDAESRCNLRDWFAGLAVQTILSALGPEDGQFFDEDGRRYCVVAAEAYAIADAMLEERRTPLMPTLRKHETA